MKEPNFPELPELPEVVYHYTTVEILLKIIEAASIWATSVNYLNDKMEGEHFLQIVRTRIPEYCRSKKLEDESIFNEFLEDAPRPFQFLPFVASFTSESDSLSQWRSYCPHGNGVSIGFRVDCLKRAFVQIGQKNANSPLLKPAFAAVKYLETNDNSACDSEIDFLVFTAKHYFEKNITEKHSKALLWLIISRATYTGGPSSSSTLRSRTKGSTDSSLPVRLEIRNACNLGLPVLLLFLTCRFRFPVSTPTT